MIKDHITAKERLSFPRKLRSEYALMFLCLTLFFVSIYSLKVVMYVN